MPVTPDDMIIHYKRLREEGRVRGMPTGEEILVGEIERLRTEDAKMRKALESIRDATMSGETPDIGLLNRIAAEALVS